MRRTIVEFDFWVGHLREALNERPVAMRLCAECEGSGIVADEDNEYAVKDCKTCLGEGKLMTL